MTSDARVVVPVPLPGPHSRTEREQPMRKHATRRFVLPGAVAGLTVPGWLRRIGVVNLLLTLVLAVAAVRLANIDVNPGGVITSILLVATVLPLLAVRPAPGLAALAVAVVVLVVQLVVGPLVTCGVVVPVTWVMWFRLGARRLRRRQQVTVVAGLLAATVVEGRLDPVLGGGLDDEVFLAAVAVGLVAVGLVLRSLAEGVEQLRTRTDELAHQRDRTAAIAVAADRARIGADLETAIRPRIAAIVAAATAARAGLAEGAVDQASAALADAERHGRDTLVSMRSVVGRLGSTPTAPLPALSDLPGLLGRAPGDVRLHLTGAAHHSGPHLELSAYRIVEQLVGLLARPRTRTDVEVRFEADGLLLDIRGTVDEEADADRRADLRAAFSSAAARAELVGGRLTSTEHTGRRQVRVALPLSLRVDALSGVGRA